jgi:hypothetical protein
MQFPQAMRSLDKTIKDEISQLLCSDLNQKIIEFFQRVPDFLDSCEEVSFKLGLLTRLLFSCLIDADRTDTARDKCESLKITE